MKPKSQKQLQNIVTNAAKAAINQSRRRRRPRSRRRKPAAQAVNRVHMADYLRLVADPCNAKLVPGLYGSDEGMLASLRQAFTTHTDGGGNDTQTCGYIFWCPDFHNQGVMSGTAPTSGTRNANVFVFNHPDSTHQPLNNTYLAVENCSYGYGAMDIAAALQVLQTATSYEDPAWNLMNSDIVADARTLSACISFTYYGKMQDSSGEFAVFDNIPIHSLLNGGAGNNPMSVDELMKASNNKQRLGVDTIEAVYRPNEQSTGVFRSKDDSMFNMDYSALTAPSTTIAPEADTLAPRCFGIAWRRVQPGAGLSFELTKNIEWRATISSGLKQPPIHSGEPVIHAVNALLDHVHNQTPGAMGVWARIKDSAASVASTVSKLAFTGTGQKLIKQGIGAAQAAAMRMAIQFVPRALPALLP